MKQFRTFATCLDGAGASIPVTWYGEGSTPDVDVQQMRDEAHGNGWSVGAIICVQQRKISKGVEVAE
ncbi:TPA: hypothetical protein RCG93_004081 [Enterobacter roggenkampii]|uniref:hypothetical protein n=1 Tax=Enterobacter TaxID=547 RepID=UPI000665D84E|nr:MULTISPECIES: hypothetical protein [Enterobacter]MDU2078124.1 hypothetical protein [Enterobacter sp.]HDT2127672.1 hypothetical protein [Enterobacter roggenkampii]